MDPILTVTAEQLIDMAMAKIQEWGWMVMITVPLVIAVAGMILSRFMRSREEY